MDFTDDTDTDAPLGDVSVSSVKSAVAPHSGPSRIELVCLATEPGASCSISLTERSGRARWSASRRPVT